MRSRLRAAHLFAVEARHGTFFSSEGCVAAGAGNGWPSAVQYANERARHKQDDKANHGHHAHSGGLQRLGRQPAESVARL